MKQIKNLVFLFFLTTFGLSCGSVETAGAKNEDTKGKKSEEPKKDNIKVKTPKNESYSRFNLVEISGQVEIISTKEFKAFLGDEELKLDSDGNFKIKNRYKEGENEITIKAKSKEDKLLVEKKVKFYVDREAPHSEFKEFDKTLIVEAGNPPGQSFKGDSKDNLALEKDLADLQSNLYNLNFSDPKDLAEGVFGGNYFFKPGMNVLSLKTKDKAGNVADETRSFIEGELIKNEGWVQKAILLSVQESMAKKFLGALKDQLLGGLDIKKLLKGQSFSVPVLGKIEIKDVKYKEMLIDFDFKDGGFEVVIILTEFELVISGVIKTVIKSNPLIISAHIDGGFEKGYLKGKVKTVKAELRNFQIGTGVSGAIGTWFIGHFLPQIEKLMEDEIKKEIQKYFDDNKDPFELWSEFDLFEKKVHIGILPYDIDFHEKFVDGYINMKVLSDGHKAGTEKPLFENSKRFNFTGPVPKLIDTENTIAISENFLHHLLFEAWQYGILYGPVDAGDTLTPGTLAAVLPGFLDHVEADKKALIKLLPKLPLVMRFDHPKDKEGNQKSGTVGIGNFEIGLGGEKEGKESIPAILSMHGHIPLELKFTADSKLKFEISQEGMLIELEESKLTESEEKIEKSLSAFKEIMLSQVLGALPELDLNDLTKSMPNLPNFTFKNHKNQVEGFLKVNLTATAKPKQPKNPPPKKP